MPVVSGRAAFVTTSDYRWRKHLQRQTFDNISTDSHCDTNKLKFPVAFTPGHPFVQL